MIPRILVPRDVRPVSKGEATKNGHRFETYMDDRTVVGLWATAPRTTS